MTWRQLAGAALVLLGCLAQFPLPSQTAWSPDLISGCQVGIVADDLALANGANIPSITSRSGCGTASTWTASATNPTYSTNVLNGHASINFNGTSSRFTSTSASVLPIPKSICWVARVNAAVSSVGTTRTIYSGINGSTTEQQSRANRASTGAQTSYQPLNNNNGAAIASSVPNATFLTACFTELDAGGGNFTGTVYVNGNPTATTGASALTTAPTTVALGAGYSGGVAADWCPCDMMEFWSWTGTLSAANVALYNNYATARYFPGMGSNATVGFLGFDSRNTQLLEFQSSNTGTSGWTRGYLGQAVNGAQAGYALRDPSVTYYNGAWWMAGTTDGGNATCGYAGSCWSLYTGVTGGQWQYAGAISVTGASSGTPSTWAPEFFTDTDGSIHIFVAYHVTGGSGTHFIYEMHPSTSSLTGAWSTGAQITASGGNASTNAIDPFVVKDGSTYWLVVSNTTSANSTDFYSCTSNCMTSGTWTYQYAAFSGTYYEGQALLDGRKIPGLGKWVVYLDDAAGAGTGDYKYSTATTLSGNTWSAPATAGLQAVTYANSGTATGYAEHGTVYLLSGLNAGAGVAQAKPRQWNAWRELWARR